MSAAEAGRKSNAARRMVTKLSDLKVVQHGYGWRPGVEEKVGHYVYVLIDPRDGRPFYVGKGQGERCFSHIFESRKTTADSKGDYPKLRQIRDIEQSGRRIQVELIRHGLDPTRVADEEDVAYAIEAAGIDLLRMLGIDPANRVSGRTRGKGWISVDEANVEYAARHGEFDPAHRVVLIRPARQYRYDIADDELYRITREWWRVAKDKREGTRAVEWAMAVYKGVVRAVFRVDGWEPAPVDADPAIVGKWRFVGAIDQRMTTHYQDMDVTYWLPIGAQNGVRYPREAAPAQAPSE